MRFSKFLIRLLTFWNSSRLVSELNGHFIRKCISSSTSEEFEDTKGVIRIRISEKNRQHNGQKKKYKGIDNDLQNIQIKLKVE